ncbi:MAG: carbon storage regulator [Oscillospiraceae bacterium]|nr:carbon storage regulator [Oscillospiraceae bacterium]
MLSLNLKDGEYLTIGEDIVIQVFTTSTIKMSVQAPKDMAILRGEVLERSGDKRPDCLYDHPSARKKARKNLTVSDG